MREDMSQERKIQDRRRIERRAPKRGVTVRHDDQDLRSKRVTRGQFEAAKKKAP